MQSVLGAVQSVHKVTSEQKVMSSAPCGSFWCDIHHWLLKAWKCIKLGNVSSLISPHYPPALAWPSLA